MEEGEGWTWPLDLSLLGRWRSAVIATPISHPRAFPSLFQREEGQGDHDLRPSFLEVWMGNGHGHSFPLPEGSRELVAIVGGYGLYPCLLGRWRNVGMVTPISLPKGIRGGMGMASILLFLEGGGVWPWSLPSHFQQQGWKG